MFRSVFSTRSVFDKFYLRIWILDVGRSMLDFNLSSRMISIQRAKADFDFALFGNITFLQNNILWIWLQDCPLLRALDSWQYECGEFTSKYYNSVEVISGFWHSSTYRVFLARCERESERERKSVLWDREIALRGRELALRRAFSEEGFLWERSSSEKEHSSFKFLRESSVSFCYIYIYI
jgi:hypothetical protein